MASKDSSTQMLRLYVIVRRVVLLAVTVLAAVVLLYAVK